MRRWRRRLMAAAATAAAAVGLVVPPATEAHAATCTTYYVSSSSGSDSNDGCTSSTPWRTLTNVNATTFTAGNQILFQAGGSWTSALAPLGSGSSGSPIVISSYGTGSAPIIEGGGASAAVFLADQQYWTIPNLEITNPASSAALRSGVQLQNDTSGTLNGIHIVNNNIHDVKGLWTNSAGVPAQPVLGHRLRRHRQQHHQRLERRPDSRRVARPPRQRQRGPLRPGLPAVLPLGLRLRQGRLVRRQRRGARTAQTPTRRSATRSAAATAQTGRPTGLLGLQLGRANPWNWAPGMSNLWRTSSDIIYYGEMPSMSRVLTNFDSALHPAAPAAPATTTTRTC